MASRSLRVCLLLGKPSVPTWFGRAVEEMCNRSPATVTSIFLPQDDSNTAPNKDLRFYADDIRSKGAWILVVGGRRLIDPFLDPLEEERSQPISDFLPTNEIPKYSCELRPADKFGYYLPEWASEYINDNVDLIVHWGVGIIQGDVLTAPTHGVVGFHHGDIREYRGGPAGFWEYVNDEPQGAVTLQQFTETLDGGRIVAIESVDIADADTWREVKRRLHQTAVPMLADGIENLRNGNHQNITELGTLYRPTDRDLNTTMKYVRRTVPAWIRTIL